MREGNHSSRHDVAADDQSVVAGDLVAGGVPAYQERVAADDQSVGFGFEVIGFGNVTVMPALSHSRISSLLK